MFNVESATITETTITRTLKVGKAGLLAMVNHHLGSFDQIPDNAEVFVTVPGGGDWSNTNLDIDDHSVEIVWTITTTDRA